jgi:hypothetical protein
MLQGVWASGRPWNKRMLEKAYIIREFLAPRDASKRFGV